MASPKRQISLATLVVIALILAGIGGGLVGGVAGYRLALDRQPVAALPTPVPQTATNPPAGTSPTALVTDARKAGLLVHIWTFRPENYFLAANFRAGADPAFRNEAGSIREIQTYIRAGIDGFFSDDPGLGRRALDSL